MEKKGVLFGSMFGLLVVLGIFIGLSGCVEYNEQGTGLENPNIEKGLFALSDDGLTASVKIFDNNVSGMNKYSYLMPENTQLLITTSEPMTVRAAKSEYGDSYVSFHGNLDAVNVDALSSYIENKFVDVNAPYARENVKTAMTLKNNKNKEQDITTKFDFDYPNDIIIINDKEINMDKGDVIRFKLFDNKIIIAKGNGNSGNMIHTNNRIDKIFIPKGANYYSLDMSDLDVDGLNSNMIITPSKKIDGGVHFELIVNSHIKPGQEVSFDPSFGIAEPTSNYIKSYKFNQTWVKSRIVSYDINNDGEKELILLKDDKINIINNNGKIINVLYEPNVIGFGRTFDAGKINDDTYIVVGAVNSILFYKYNNRTNDFDKPIILNTNGFTFIDYAKIVETDLFNDGNDYLIFGSYTGIDKYTGIISIVKLDKQISKTNLNPINFYIKAKGNLVFAPNDVVIKDMNGDGNKDMIIAYPYIDTVYIVPVNKMGGDLDQIYMNKFNGDDELFGASMVTGKDMKDKIFIGAPGKDNESGYIYLMTRIKGTNEYNKTKLIKGTKGFGSSITFANGLNRLYIGSPDESAVYSFDFKADDENKLELNKVYTTSDKKSRFGDELGMVYDSPSKGELVVIAPNESLGGVLYSITETTTTHCVNLSDSSTWDPDGDGIDNIELGDEHFIIYQNTTLCQGTYDLSYLPDEPGGAIYFWGSNIFLDCNNSVLIAGGPDMPYSRSGIRIDNKNKITIKNCVISGFIRGIEIKNATSCNFINNTIEYTKQGFLSYGLYFSNLTNNTIRYNFRDGLYLTSLTSGGVTYAIQNNKIINNKIYENGRDGILLQGGHDLANNTIVSNAIYNNSAHGISIYQIDNNNISGNEVCNNGIDDINLFGTSSNFGDNICDNLTNPTPSPVTCSQPCGCTDCGNLINVHITPEMPNTDNINNDDNLTCTVHITTQNNGCTSGTVTFNWTATPYASSSTPNTPPGCTNQITTVPFTITGSGDVSDYYSLNISRHPCTSGAGLLYNIINCSATVNYTNGQCTPESDWDAVCVVPTLHSGEGNLNVHICNCSSPQTSSHPPCVCDNDPNILPLNSPSTLYCTFNTTVFQRMLSQWIIGGGPGGGSVNISFYDQNGNLLQTNSCPTTYNFNNYFGPSGCAVYQCNSPACYQPNNVSCSVGITSSFSPTSGMVCPLTGLTAGGSSEDITVRPPIGWLQTVIYADGVIEPDMGGSPHATRNSTFVCLGSGSYSVGDPINLSEYSVTFYTYDSSGNYHTLARRRCDRTPPAYYYVNDPNSQDENACNVYLGCSGNGLCIKGRDVYCNMTPISLYNLDPLSNSSGPIRVHNTPPKIGPPITVLTGNIFSCKLNSSSYQDIDNDGGCPGGCDPVSNVTYYWQWLGNSSWHGSDSEIQNPDNIYWLNITPCSDMYTQPGYAHIFPDSFEIHRTTQEDAHWCRGVIPSGTLYTNVSSLFEDAFCTNLSSIHGSSGATNYIDWYDVSADNYLSNCDDNYRGSSTDPSQSFTLSKNDLFFKDMNGFYFGRFIYHPISVRCCMRVEDTESPNGDEQNWSNVICSSPEICNDMGACGNCTIQYDLSGNAINITCTQNASCITNESAGIQCYTYNYNTCTGNSNPTNPLDEFINSSNPDYRAVSRCTGCYNVTRCVKKIDDTTGEIEYYHHIFDKCNSNVYEYKLNLSDPDNLSWAKEHCDIVNCESKYGSAYGPKNSTTGDWRYYDIPDVETVNVVSPIPDPNDNMAGQYSEFECTPNANEIITELHDNTTHVCLPEDDPLCSGANYTEITNYTIHYHKRLYRWKYSNIWDPLFWTECESDGDDRCDNSDSLFPGYVKNGYITGWTEGLKRINCSTYDICKKHEQVSCDYQEIINYTKNVTRIGRWNCSMINGTPICSGSSDGSTPFSIETIINTSENGSDDDAICGLSRGIIINNTAPIINSIDILNQSGGTYLAPIPMIPSSSSPGYYTDYVYAKCIPDFNDIDTHVPDDADTILYAFNYTNGAGTIQLQDYTDKGDGGDLLNLSEMIGHITSLNAGDKITCCVKMNDTHWQSKWSNTSCKTVPVGNQAPVCDYVNLTGDCKIGQFTCEAVGCTDPDGHSLGNYYYTILNSSGHVLMTNVSSSNTWTFNGQDWMNKCEPIYCGVVVEDNPPYPLTPVNSTEYYNSTNVSNCAPQVSPTMQIASGDLTTGIVYLDSGYSDPDDDPPEQFYWTITYTDSFGVSHNIYPGSDYYDIIINYTNPVDTDGRNWSWGSSSIQFYSLNYVPGLSGHDLSDIRNVSPFINMSALPGGGITSTGEKLTVCVKAQDYDNDHANCHNTTDYICRDITYLSRSSYAPVINSMDITGGDCPGQNLTCIINVTDPDGGELNITSIIEPGYSPIPVGLPITHTCSCIVGINCSNVTWNTGYNDTNLGEQYICSATVTDGTNRVSNETNIIITDTGCPPGPITTCRVINNPGYYYLNNSITVDGTLEFPHHGTGSDGWSEVHPDVLNSTDPDIYNFLNWYPERVYCCIIINTSNVTLDLNGKNLNLGNGIAMSNSVIEAGGICGGKTINNGYTNVDNITITNGTMNGWDRAIVFNGSDNIMINDMNIIGGFGMFGSSPLAYGASGGKSTGISLCSVDNANIKDNNFEFYRAEVQIMGSNNVTVSDSNFTTGSRGIETYNWPVLRCGNSNNARFINNRFSDCMDGIRLSDINNTLIENSFFDRNRAMGIDIYTNMDNLNISNNEFAYNGRLVSGGGSIDYGAVTIRYMSDIKGDNYISNNNFEGNTRGILFDRGWNLNTNAHSINVINNTIMTSKFAGIEIKSGINFINNINFMDNNVSNNQGYGLLFSHPKPVGTSYPIYTTLFLDSFNTSGWTGDHINLTVSDPSNPSIEKAVIQLPFCEDITDPYSQYYALIPLNTLSQCYTPGTDTITVYIRGCRNISGDAPTVTTNLTVYSNTGLVTSNYTSELIGSTSANHFTTVQVTVPFRGVFYINGTVTCDYSDDSLDKELIIPTEYLNVENNCPSPALHINGYPQYNEMNTTLLCLWKNTNVSGLSVPVDIVGAIPIGAEWNGYLITMTDSGGTGGYSEISGTPGYKYNISLSNDYVCYNNQGDVNDTMYYMPDIYPDNLTRYSEVTCNSTKSNSSSNYPNSPCTYECGVIPRTRITNCTVINSSGNYYLDNDIDWIMNDPLNGGLTGLKQYNPPFTVGGFFPKACCIVINASNVNLDLNGHYISADYDTYGFDGSQLAGGICVKPRKENPNVYNGSVRNWRWGIVSYDAKMTDVQNISLSRDKNTSKYSYGISVINADYHNIGNIDISGNYSIGILVSNTDASIYNITGHNLWYSGNYSSLIASDDAYPDHLYSSDLVIINANLSDSPNVKLMDIENTTNLIINTVSSVNSDGIYIYNSTMGDISNATIVNGTIGLALIDSLEISIDGLYVNESDTGILLKHINRDNVDNSIITNNNIGINISDSATYNLTNDYICDNIIDISRSSPAAPGSNPSYSNLTCEKTDPPDLASTACTYPCSACRLSINGLSSCYQPGQNIKFTINDSIGSTGEIADVYLLNSSGDSLFNCRYSTGGSGSGGASNCVDLYDTSIPSCNGYVPGVTSRYPLCINDSSGNFYGFVIFNDTTLCEKDYNVSEIISQHGLNVLPMRTFMIIKSDSITLDCNYAKVFGGGVGYIMSGIGGDISNPELRNNITIKNCDVSGFQNHGLVLDMNNSKIMNTVIHGCNNGIYIQNNLLGTTFSDVTASCNSGYGVVFSGGVANNNLMNVNLCCNANGSDHAYPAGGSLGFTNHVNVSCDSGSRLYLYGFCGSNCPAWSSSTCNSICSNAPPSPIRYCSGSISIPVDSGMPIGNYNIIANNSPNDCIPASGSFRISSDCNPERPCTCDLSIDSINWSSVGTEGACENDTVTVYASIDYDGDCSDDDIDGAILDVTDPDGYLIFGAIPITVNPDDDRKGHFSFRFNATDPLGTYSLKVSKDNCSMALGQVRHISCYPAPCSIFWGAYDPENNLLCCDTAHMKNITGYPFVLTNMDGECCVGLGEHCDQTYERLNRELFAEHNDTMCCEGICINGTCQIPIKKPQNKNNETINQSFPLGNKTIFECSNSVCNRTGICCQGYCDNDVCVFPPGNKHIFGLYPKAGCEGLPVEPIGIFGIIICDLMWLYVIALSIIAGYYSRKEKNKAVPVTSVAAPILVALIMYPFIGVFTAIAELVILFYREKKRSEKEGEEKEKPSALTPKLPKIPKKTSFKNPYEYK